MSKHWRNTRKRGAKPVARNPLDDPTFWREFLKRLTFYNPEYDAELVADFCRTFKVAPETVAARLRSVYVPGLH